MRGVARPNAACSRQIPVQHSHFQSPPYKMHSMGTSCIPTADHSGRGKAAGGQAVHLVVSCRSGHAVHYMDADQGALCSELAPEQLARWLSLPCAMPSNRCSLRLDCRPQYKLGSRGPSCAICEELEASHAVQRARSSWSSAPCSGRDPEQHARLPIPPRVMHNMGCQLHP